MNFDALTAGMEGTRTRPDLNPSIAGISRDSRAVQPGHLFAALVGDRVDATRFLPSALDAGAGALLIDERGTIPQGLDLNDVAAPALVVANGRAALARIAHRYYGYPLDQLTSIAVTGTNGKTTTSAMIEAIFAAAGKACGVIGTIFFRLGMWEIHGDNTTPESLDLASLVRAYIDRGAAAVVLEASSHGLEMHRLDDAHFDVGVFTNLTLDHLDYHGDMEAYYAAKRRLFDDHLPASRQAGKLGLSVINRDDPYGRRLLDETAAPAVSYGLTDESDVFASALRLEASVSRFRLHVPDQAPVEITLPMAGRHNVFNALGAAAACVSVGCPVDAIAAGLSSLEPVRGRMEPVVRDDGQGPTVFVDYAHTPDALERVLIALRELDPVELRVVFGCGGDRDTSKRPEMGSIAGRLADLVVATSDNPRSEPPEAIIDAIVAGLEYVGRERVDGSLMESRALGIGGFLREADRAAAIHQAVATAPTGAIVLIAGKGHETTQETAGTKVPFDDADQARSALANWEGGAA